MARIPIRWNRQCHRSGSELAALLMLGAALMTSGCGGKTGSAENGGSHAGGPSGQGRPGEVQEQPIPVAVETARTGPIASYFNATSSLEAEKQAEVLARASGMVAEMLCEEGDVVAEGQPLLRIGNEEYSLRLKQAEAATANLQARFHRLEAMMAEQLATEEEYQAARSDLSSAEADEGLARLSLSYTTVKAPFGGLVTRRLVDAGQNLSVGTPLVVLADFQPLLARIHVPSREFNKLQIDQAVDLVLDSSGERLQGRIKLISPVIDPESGTIKLTVEVLQFPAGTRAGDFAQVRIITELHPEALLVPRAAVLTDKGEQAVFVAVPGEGDQGLPRAERRVVTVGFTDDQNAEILAGLEDGDEVVVRGQRSLKHGSPLKVLTGGPAALGS